MKNKLKCILLDDEIPGLTYLKMICEQLPELEVVKAFNNPTTFLSEVPNLDFDLCILDIEMPEMNGLQVANLLTNKAIIFTTAYSEYAAEAFDIDAIDYVRKPIKKERLQQAVTKAFNQLSEKTSKNNFVQLNTNKGKALIYFDQLCYVKIADSDSRDKIAIFNDGSTLTLKNISFEKLQTLLPSGNFCRVNKQELISLKIVQVFSYDEITTTLKGADGKPLKVSLSESYRNDFLKKTNE